MHFKTRILALAMTGLLPLTAMAIGGPSGPKIDYHTQGHLGEVMMNPYGIAPLTAVIRDGGYTLEDVKVRIVPKQNGAEIAYKVSPSQVLTSHFAVCCVLLRRSVPRHSPYALSCFTF